MNKIIKYFLIMLMLGLFTSVTLSFINEITFPIIEEQKLKKVEKLLLNVDNVNKWVSGEKYINISDDEYIQYVYISIDDNNKYQFIAYYTITKGYSNGNIEALIFIDCNKKNINSIEIINIENQTKGIGSLIQDDPNYVNCFKNVSVNKYVGDNVNSHNSDSFDIISGATVSSRGVVQALISSCNNFNEFWSNNESEK